MILKRLIDINKTKNKYLEFIYTVKMKGNRKKVQAKDFSNNNLTSRK